MSSLRTSVPHPAAAELRRWTLDEFRELTELRAALRSALGDPDDDPDDSAPRDPDGSALGDPDGDPDDLCERIAVVATELATNALRHGLPPTVVRLMRQGDRIILDVADHDLAASPQPADRPLGKGGLGLRLTQTFAADVGWYITDETKHVWASFPG